MESVKELFILPKDSILMRLRVLQSLTKNCLFSLNIRFQQDSVCPTLRGLKVENAESVISPRDWILS
jgi:hypothetical protein